MADMELPEFDVWVANAVGSSSDAKLRELFEQLKKRVDAHMGLDAWAAGPDYPHPSQRAKTLTFFHGNGRLDETGIQFVQDQVNPPPAITVVSDQFYDDPASVAPRFIIAPNVYAGSLPNSYQVGMVTVGGSYGISGSYGSNDEVYLEAGSAGLSFYTPFIPADGSVEGWYFHGGPLCFNITTADPGGLTDGMIWYRSDTDKFRVRLNGATQSLSTEAYVDAEIVTLTAYIDAEIAAIGSSQANIWPYTAKTANYTTVATDGFVRASASGGSFTISLVHAGTAGSGAIQVVKKIDSSANTVTIDPNSAQTIDGQTTLVLRKQYDSAAFLSDGSNWHLIARVKKDSYVSSTSNYTVTTEDNTIGIDATAATRTVSLPEAAISEGRVLTITKLNSANIVLIDAYISETINGLPNYGLSRIYSYVTLLCTGAEWIIIGEG